MVKTIKVIYTKKRLSEEEISMLGCKVYTYLCDNDEVEKGMLIESSDFTTSFQVVSVIDNCQTNYDGMKLSMIHLSNKSKNQNKSKEIKTEKKKMEKKSFFKKFIEKYKSQFMPEKDENITLSFDGNVCVPIDGEYIGIDADNNLISYPDEMVTGIPMFFVSKPYSSVKEGDVVKIDNNYAKVLKKSDKNYLTCLTFSGYTEKKKEIKDFMLGQSFVKVAMNATSFLENGKGFDPTMFVLMSGDGDDSSMKDFMMARYMQGMMKGDNTNNINDFMLLALMDKEGGKSSFIESMVMMKMFKEGGFNFPTSTPIKLND